MDLIKFGRDKYIFTLDLNLRMNRLNEPLENSGVKEGHWFSSDCTDIFQSSFAAVLARTAKLLPRWRLQSHCKVTA